MSQRLYVVCLWSLCPGILFPVTWDFRLLWIEMCFYRKAFTCFWFWNWISRIWNDFLLYIFIHMIWCYGKPLYIPKKKKKLRRVYPSVSTRLPVFRSRISLGTLPRHRPSPSGQAHPVASPVDSVACHPRVSSLWVLLKMLPGLSFHLLILIFP